MVRVGAMNVRVEKIAENTFVKIVARGTMVAMFPLMGAASTLAWQYIDGRFDAQAKETGELRSTVQKFDGRLTAIEPKVTALETNQGRDSEDRQRFQEQTTAMLQELLRGQSAANARLSGLEAKMEAQQREIDKQGSRRP